MQQGGSQYGVSSEMTPFTGADNPTHMFGGGVSGGSDNLQQQQKKSGDAVLVAQAASPISSRPPAAASSSGNFEELAGPASGGFTDDDTLAGEEVERGMTGGNRWPRQETLALLKIRSEMDAAFRDATLKGPLWEDISRKLAELGYVRSAKKCKEKFENVHKYYKRTKEGRASRQDGKSYRFFSQLEALHSASSKTGANPIIPTATSTLAPTPMATTLDPIIGTTTNPVAAPTSIGFGSNNPIVVCSSGRMQPTTATTVATSTKTATVSTTTAAATNQGGVPRFGPDTSAQIVQAPGTGITGSVRVATTIPAGISFSSNTSSSSSSSFSSDSEDDDKDDLEGMPTNTESRKRKRRSSRGDSSSRKMISFFEGLMKQVMEKQEAMQQRFLETIEKREQDRMIREEAWKRQEMTRLSREHEIMAQDRAISATRDAAIIAFLKNITGQTIQLPPPISIPTAPPPPQHTSVIAPPPPPAPQQQQQPQQLQQKQQQKQLHHKPQVHQTGNTDEVIRSNQPPTSAELAVAVPEHEHQLTMAVPEKQHQPHQLLAQEMVTSGGGGSFDPTSSRWPKAEVHALIKLRSGLESRYQEAGPKGPLWEEISVGMQKMGYNRSSKRCKEKWENINKYFKKVKESNKRRPEDAKTCPYFHQLDALYQKKILGGSIGGSSSSFGNQSKPEQQQDTVGPNSTTTTSLSGRSDVLALMPPPPQPPLTPQTSSDVETKNPNNSSNNNKSDAHTKVQTSNGALMAPSSLEEGSSGVGGAAPAASVKKKTQ
ncbi:trihelix transcription factor GTL1-like isoform X2 [Macadamia integrifolia]|uniref:trihelix transcription factor GTL1-like isoform X2 n=1 Tax=Macadamia integrifolia TaxID=60698 RepID=UPI001C4F2B2A|nr:trihelix transcription factor GTL1-like isoform X2 [Macadamia integrifolia]